MTANTSKIVSFFTRDSSQLSDSEVDKIWERYWQESLKGMFLEFRENVKKDPEMSALLKKFETDEKMEVKSIFAAFGISAVFSGEITAAYFSLTSNFVWVENLDAINQPHEFLFCVLATISVGGIFTIGSGIVHERKRRALKKEIQVELAKKIKILSGLLLSTKYRTKKDFELVLSIFRDNPRLLKKIKKKVYLRNNEWLDVLYEDIAKMFVAIENDTWSIKDAYLLSFILKDMEFDRSFRINFAESFKEVS